MHLLIIVTLIWLIIGSCSAALLSKLSFLDSINIDGQNWNEDPANWCNYLQTTQEPQLILYNRMPKCGSTTMEQLFRKISRRSNGKLRLWQTKPTYWVDFSVFHREKVSFSSGIKSKLRKWPRSTLIVDGHWDQFNFTYNFIQDANVEYIQLIRECISRRRSMFFYSLYDSKSSLAHGRARNSSYKLDYQLKSMHTDNLDACFHDYACLTKNGNIERFSSADAELKMLCGSGCKRLNKGNQTQGALANARNPSAFTVIGSLSRLSEYLEMLECAYPRALGGIRSVYDRTEFHSNEGSVHNTTQAIERVLQELCQQSDYSRVYPIIDRIASERYLYMSKNKERCCRKG